MVVRLITPLEVPRRLPDDWKECTFRCIPAPAQPITAVITDFTVSLSEETVNQPAEKGWSREEEEQEVTSVRKPGLPGFGDSYAGAKRPTLALSPIGCCIRYFGN